MRTIISFVKSCGIYLLLLAARYVNTSIARCRTFNVSVNVVGVISFHCVMSYGMHLISHYYLGIGNIYYLLDELKVVIMITFGFIDRNGVFGISKSPYFSHYVCEILRATDVACKSYKRKRSESSEILVTTIITIHEFSLHFRL